jgi:hypothetical protein
MDATTIPSPKLSKRLWWSRVLIGGVIFTNLQCAFVFFLNPFSYIQAYDLNGVPGAYAIQGFGILFAMWNIPYLFAFIHPQKNRISLYEALIMQSIGLLGESFLYFRLPMGFPNLAASIQRFILFDGVGLMALILSFLLTRSHKQS